MLLNTSLPGCAGCRVAYDIATMPPNEMPITIGRSISSASQNARTSSPHCAQIPFRLIAAIAAPVAAMVEIDDLRDLREPREVGLEVRMVEARPAMQQDHRRHLAHLRAVGPQLRAFDIEEQANIANIYSHRRISNANHSEVQTFAYAPFAREL